MYYLENKKLSLEHDNEIKELAKALTQCGENRKQYAHGSWLHASPVKGISVNLKSKKSGAERVYRKFNDEEMRKDLNLITSTRVHLAHFHNRILHQKVR